MAQIVRFPDVLQKNPRTSTKSTRSPVHDLLSRQLGVAARARAPSAPASSAPRSSSDLLRVSPAPSSSAPPLASSASPPRGSPRSSSAPPPASPVCRASPDPASPSCATNCSALICPAPICSVKEGDVFVVPAGRPGWSPTWPTPTAGGSADLRATVARWQRRPDRALAPARLPQHGRARPPVPPSHRPTAATSSLVPLDPPPIPAAGPSPPTRART